MKIHFIDWVMKCECLPKLIQMQMDCEGLTLLFF